MTKPNKPGFYWALWLKATPETHEGDELTPASGWEVVQVVENFIGDPCESDVDEKFIVFVPGVSEAQWLDNFKWGPGLPNMVSCPQHGYEDGEPHHLCARCQGAEIVPS